ncbi:HIRAN domain-containing protein [uncultured Ruminococcus sp.]|uniref:HIRAN domain-containing protein n=1 Tax=uncultured Ruminococcus sp. TaxID=165186 RepID=UPI0025D1D2A6|nr:HIRAN domain-containing protein [uncultured Ruminococcus sp.]
MDESTGLTIHKSEAVALTQNGGLAKAIKPLTKEIHLFDTYVAGVSYLKDKTVLQEIKIKDRLTLQREDNKFDDKAIVVLSSDGKKLGYVPEKDNIIFSRLMDAGKLLVAYIIEIKKRSIDYQQISIGIYLVDF